MAETVGFVSALLGLTVLAYDTSKSLYEEVSSFKSRRKSIEDLQADLGSLVSVLDLIRKQAQSQKVERFEPLYQPLEYCSETCQELRETLDACTKSSKEGKDSVRSWLNMRYHEKSFDEMKGRLASYKSTLSITFQSINMQDTSITQDSLEDLKDSIHGAKEDLEFQLDQVRQAISDADGSPSAVIQVDETRLRNSLESLAQAQRVADATRPQVVVEDNRAGPGSHAIFGTDTVQPQLTLNVSNNEAGLGSVVGAGAYTPQTLQTLLGNSQAPDLTFTLQALQAQLRTTDGTGLQSLLHNLSAEHKRGLTDAPPEVRYPRRSRTVAHGTIESPAQLSG